MDYTGAINTANILIFSFPQLRLCQALQMPDKISLITDLKFIRDNTRDRIEGLYLTGLHVTPQKHCGILTANVFKQFFLRKCISLFP